MFEHCIIITGYIEGSIRDILASPCLFEHGWTDGAFILCADSGWDKSLAEEIRPHLIMGDFDSLEGSLPEDVDVVTHPSHKDDTDTGLALRYALDNGFKRVTVVGGIGGRLDHTMANIQDIAGYTEKGLEIVMRDSRNLFTVRQEGSYEIPRFQGHTLSLFAYGGDAEVSVSGVEYPLRRHVLRTDYPLGVSNEFLEEKASLTVHRGTILLIISQT